jgi:hypothetical protein
MSEIQRLDTAFARPRFKVPRVEDPKHLIFIRKLPCLITMHFPVDACHIRYGDQAHGKRETGMQEKPSDCWTVPMCREKHAEQHAGSERAFWERYGIDPLEVARELFRHTGDEQAGFDIIQRYSKGPAAW